MNFPALAPGTPWFVALPDSDAAGTIAAVLRRKARMSISYGSGRPWLLGEWSGDGITLAEAGSSRVAVIGSRTVTAARLTRILEQARDVTSLIPALSACQGSYHIAAVVGGRSVVRGTASGVRRVFYAAINGEVVAADRADVLAGLSAAELDRTAVALSLLDPTPPYPLDELPMWQGIEAVPPDHYLLVGADARPSMFRWWSPPEAATPLRDGARRLRVALAHAVDARTYRGGVVSCDLSGGLDSTSVYLLARRSPAELIAYTAVGLDPGDDDLDWADRALATLPDARHEVLPREELPLVYEGVAAAPDQLDAPFIGLIDRAQLLAACGRLAPLGARVHLTGFGGDEVLEADLSYVRSLARRRPSTALGHLRAYQIQARWALGSTAWRLLRPRSYRAWWAETISGLTEPRQPPRMPSLDWGAPPRLPAWVTADAVALVQRRLADLADLAQPLAESCSSHANLLAVRSSARIVRLFAQLAAPTGLPVAAPFLDDQVIEACLAVREHERTTPWQYKPLLKEAMRGIVPAESLERVTKAECSAEEEAGLRAHRGELLALCDESRLAGLGLIDEEKLRASCHYSPEPHRPHMSLQQTIACEMWLRQAQKNVPARALTGSHGDEIGR